MHRSAALVAVTIPGQQPAPSGGVGKAASPVLSHNPGASSSVTNGGAGSTINSLAGSTAAAVSSITQVSPSLFASALTTTVPPAAGAPPAAQSTVTPFGSSSAQGLARSFGQSLLVSQGQVPGSAHAGQEVDLLDGEATGSQIDETEEPEPFVKNIEKPNAPAPAHAPEERLEPAPEPDPLPIFPEMSSSEPWMSILACSPQCSRPGRLDRRAHQEARLVTGFLGRARVGHSVGSLCCSPHTIVAIESA